MWGKITLACGFKYHTIVDHSEVLQVTAVRCQRRRHALKKLLTDTKPVGGHVPKAGINLLY